MQAVSEDQEDPCGLKNRIRIACEPPLNQAAVAAILDVDVTVIQNILTIPDYVPSPQDYQTIAENLPNISARRHFRGTTQNWTVYFLEKPLWTEDDVYNTFPEDRDEQAVIIVCDPLYPDRLKSDGPYRFDTFTLQQMIEAATDGDYLRLLTVALYVPSVEYPYNP